MSHDTILIVDDEKNILKTISMSLNSNNYETITSLNGKEAIGIVDTKDIGLVILDVMMPDIDGIELLKIFKIKKPEICAIVMSGHASIRTAVEATKLGAYDFLEKPVSLERLLLAVQRALDFRTLKTENVALKSEIEKKNSLIGNSPAMLDLYKKIELVGPTSSRVLIQGRNGTGKELVARALHLASLRFDKQFIKVNCAAIPHELIESELFGHEKGAFTGATSMRRGKFELANKGTIFLDEIGDMHLDTQAKVLRVLQEGEFERVGGYELIKVDVRVIAATNKNLEEEIKKGNFREDLFFRLNVIPFYISSLRERQEDIPLIAEYFLKEFSEEYGRKQKTLTDDAMHILINYNWPGNVRELKNFMERIVIMVSDDIIDSNVLIRLFPNLSSIQALPRKDVLNANLPLKDVVNEFEKNFILENLKKHNWHIAETARSLDIERSHLYKKIKQFEIQLPNH